MHPIPANWSDWICYIDSSRTIGNCSNSLISLNKLRSTSLRVPSDRFGRSPPSRLSISFASIISIISTAVKRKRKCLLSILLTIVLNYLLEPKAVVATPSTISSATNRIVVVDLETNQTAIDNLSFDSPSNRGTAHNLIRNSSSSNLKDQFFRTIRSIKLTNHRLKRRRSFTNVDKNYATSQAISKHSAKTNNWSVLGSQEEEYALKLLENEHLTSAILHFIEITYKYAELNLPTNQLLDNINDTTNSTTATKANAVLTADGKKSDNKYYNTGSCVQVKLDSLKGLLKGRRFAKYAKQAETAKRTASLLTTLLSERLELTSDRNYLKNHPFTHNQTSNLVLHRAFFWSLLKVNLQSDANLFANGIVFRPDLNQFPIKLFFNSIQSNDDDNQESVNSTNKPFCPYIFRKKANSFRAKLPTTSSSTSVSNSSTQANTNRSTCNYVNLSGVSSFTPRILPNPNSKYSVAEVRESMEEKVANLNQLKNTLYSKKQPDPYSNTYSYSSDWYLHYANKYLNNNSQPLNYHELMKSFYLNDSLYPGYWTVPYSDCSVTGTWLLTFSVPFFGLSKSTNQIEFK